MTRKGWQLLSSSVALALIIAVAVLAWPSHGQRHGPASTVYVEGSALAPTESLSDWVSYADNVIVGRVVSSQQQAAPENTATGEGYVGEQLMIRTVTTLWTAEGQPAAPATFPLQGLGWTEHSGVLHPVAMQGAVRLAPGDVFLAPVASVDGHLTLLSPSSVLPIATDGSVHPNNASDRVAGLLSGRKAADVAAALRNAIPNEIARTHRNLPLRARVDAVLQAAQSQGAG